MKKAALLVMIITMVSKILGFGRNSTFICLWASSITDAYLISQTIPLVIFSFISAGVATGFIPCTVGSEEDGQCSANQFAVI